MKTVKFKNAKYVGDPINAVRILNEKEVDELVFLDIDATPGGSGPNFRLLEDIASEAFMPFGYGGGITSLDDIRKLLAIGIEKVILNSAAESTHSLVTEAASMAGSSSVVVSVDVRRGLFGKYTVYACSGTRPSSEGLLSYAKEMERRGAGELLLNCIDRDGMMQGYDLELIRRISDELSIPVVALGGAGRLEHFREAVDSGASAVGAGSMFVFHGKHRAVLITYPSYEELERLFE